MRLFNVPKAFCYCFQAISTQIHSNESNPIERPFSTHFTLIFNGQFFNRHNWMRDEFEILFECVRHERNTSAIHTNQSWHLKTFPFSAIRLEFENKMQTNRLCVRCPTVLCNNYVKSLSNGSKQSVDIRADAVIRHRSIPQWIIILFLFTFFRFVIFVRCVFYCFGLFL